MYPTLKNEIIASPYAKNEKIVNAYIRTIEELKEFVMNVWP
jgi:hypothetical protein